MRDAQYSKGKKILFSAMAALLTLVVALGAGEILTRLFWKERPNLASDERTLSYRYDQELGWFPVKNSSLQFKGSRVISIQHNEDGFRDRAHGPKGKKRIAFLGDSYVWGYDAEVEERFTEKLQARLPEWEVLNLGVSGYGTDQEFILLQKVFDRYQPDILVLVFSDNDVEENTMNTAHKGYYKPYFEEVDHELVERGVPVPKSIRYYEAEYPLLFKSQLAQMLAGSYLARRTPKHVSAANPTLKIIWQMKRYVESRGTRFIVAYVDDLQGDKKRAFCEACKIDYLFLMDSSLMNWEFLYPTQGNHWRPKGHDHVCSKLYEFLTANHFVQTGMTHTNSPN